MTNIEHHNRVENLLAEPGLSPYTKIVWVAIALYDLSEDDTSPRQSSQLARLTGLSRRVVNMALEDISLRSFMAAVQIKEQLETEYPAIKKLT
jgi:hypothetical protein